MSLRVLGKNGGSNFDIADAIIYAMENGASVINMSSVSYTHLRAHETVLDLVCRLLLEKKNDKSHTVR